MKGGSANRMAVKKSKKKGGPNIQQAAGLIRYFDEESEDAIQISKGAEKAFIWWHCKHMKLGVP